MRLSFLGSIGPCFSYPVYRPGDRGRKLPVQGVLKKVFRWRSLLLLAGAAIAAAGMAACGGDDDDAEPTPLPTAPAAAGDIVETAVAAGNFTTLARALEAAGLVETLKGAGPFTVFAPTDAAFAALPAGTLDRLLANKAELTKVLT